MRLPLAQLKILPIAGLVWFGIWTATPAEAASLSTLRDYLPRQQANLTSGQVHQFFFTPATNLPGGGNTLVLEYPANHSGQWCRTAGSDLVATGLTDPEGAVEGATILPGVLTADCAQGDGVSFGDRLTVSGIDPLTAGTKYGVRLADGTVAQLGTPGAANNILVNVKTTDGVIDVDDGYFWTAVIGNDRVVISAQVTVAPEPPSNPTVQFQGLASPNAVVEFYRDGTLIHTTNSNTDASFDVTLVNQSVGQHIYEITANDEDGRAHTASTFGLNLTAGSTTLISGAFLGPSIESTPASVRLGQAVSVLGKSATDSALRLTVLPGPKTFDLTVDNQGAWSELINTSELGVGEYSLSARAESSTGLVSEISRTVTFTVTAIDTPPPPGPCVGKSRADLNCDGRVNLSDFSVLLYYWMSTAPENTRADINQDGRVTIIDFSIVFYLWTG